ncbi:TPR-like protein [Trichodelitschia bisporula]|uniref:TPR-like protein n=1 Tax=Trichodelitschia bisporula TaxID=703511 RepID=A0A6G1HQR6_9PEZI|nr:TPR-like protein [Trichodelitschia bisporula]
MAPLNSSVELHLKGAIYYHLDTNNLSNALFFAERLQAESPRNPDADHLVALCHYGLGEYNLARDVSKDSGAEGQHLGCAYVYAQVCLILKRAVDGIRALERSKHVWLGRNGLNKSSETSRQHLPDAAAVYCLLGKLWRVNRDYTKAAVNYLEALRLNPYMWDAFTDLADCGVALRTANVFKFSPDFLAGLQTVREDTTALSGVISYTQAAAQGENGPQNFVLSSGDDPFAPSTHTGESGIGGKGNLLFQLTSSAPNLALPGASRIAGWASQPETMEDVTMTDANPFQEEVPSVPAPRKNRMQNFMEDLVSDSKIGPMTTRSKFRTKAGSETTEADTSVPPITGSKRTANGQPAANGSSIAGPIRRSHRLLGVGRSNTSASAKETDKDKRDRKPKPVPTRATRGTATVGRVVSGNRKPPEPLDRDTKEGQVNRPASVTSLASNASTIRDLSLAKKGKAAPAQPVLTETEDLLRPDKDAITYLLTVLRNMGEGYFQVRRYQSTLALKALNALPKNQRDTHWVVSMMARCHYEMGSYKKAAEIFAKVMKMAPLRTEGMEMYSTALWHLKKESELGFLCHFLRDIDRLSPQTWCALGNYYSLTREHDKAVKCFSRATDTAPTFAYAWTLEGHEHVANEELDKALSAYRQATNVDPRHYNGWYGLGQVYEKLGDYGAAETNFRRAVEINPNNAVLLTCVGIVSERTHRMEMALDFYTRACDVDPRSPKPRFMKARCLMRVGRYIEARKEFDVLRELAPDEAMVHYSYGRLAKKLGDKKTAVRSFSIALNLDPKASAHIKDALETLDDEDSEDEMFDNGA